jgi:hypothetical protein
MCGVTLDFKLLEDNHSGRQIATMVRTVINTYGLREKIIGCVVDNASANDVAVRRIAAALQLNETTFPTPEELHYRCFGHIMNLACQGVY